VSAAGNLFAPSTGELLAVDGNDSVYGRSKGEMPVQ
jgi:hypothetical protein